MTQAERQAIALCEKCDKELFHTKDISYCPECGDSSARCFDCEEHHPCCGFPVCHVCDKNANGKLICPNCND